MDTIKSAVNSATESVKEMGASASKEQNKEVAKGNTNASMSDRASAALDAGSDKINEEKHASKSEAHKQEAKH